jgi:hypothetical protein
MAVIKPSLVLGVGGSGYWILSLLKRQLFINYGIDVDKSSEVKFLLLDTLSESKFETEYQDHIKSIGEKFAIKRKEYLHLTDMQEGFFKWANDERNYSDPLYSWFRRKLFIENFPAEADWTLTDGAAQKRQFGRMAFFFNKNRIKQAITTLLKELSVTARDSTIPVWIFGSFAGGTGSGMMLDIAILTKLIADQNAMKIRTIGGIVLPEVYKGKITSPAQGYAAFRELSRYLSFTKEEHRANMDNHNCTHVVPYDRHDVFYHNRFVFDNILYFNEECRSDLERRNYFNKIADGLTIFFDFSGAKQFFDEIINHIENHATSISSFKIFVPINLYTQLFTAGFLKEQINKIFPNGPDSMILYPAEDRQIEIRKDTKNFLNDLSPYFLELSPLVDDDQKSLKYTREWVINKPGTIFKDLLGYNNPQKYFGESVNNANYRNQLENLVRGIFADEETKSADELRKYIRLRRENEKNYSLNRYLAEFKTRVDKKYQAYEKIFKADDEDRSAIKNSILAHFKSKARDHVRLHFQEYGVTGMYYFLQQTTAVLEGNSEASGGIKRILTNIIKAEFTTLRPEMDSDVNKVAGEITKADLETGSGGIFGSLMGKGGEAYETAAHLCAKYLEVKSKYLLFAQSDNLISLLVEIHDEFSNYIRYSLLKRLTDKNSSISIERNSIKTNLSNQIIDIRSVIRSGVGNASSIGIIGDADEIAAYEKYLKENIFAEAPFIGLKADFDSETETFRLKYTDNNNNEFLDSTAVDFNDDNPQERFWNRIYNDVYNHIVETRLPRYEGIMHYLNWARNQVGEKGQFNAVLEKKLLQARSFIKLNPDSAKNYRLIFGDTTAGEYKLEDDLDTLKKKLSAEVGNPVSAPNDSNNTLEFGDRNALIFFVYSNEIMPDSIEVLRSMREEYIQKITSKGAVNWRTHTYHNYKCDWKMWEIERMLPEFKTRGIKALTHGSFSWVLEHDQEVKLFVQCAAVGIVRKEESVDRHVYWVCGPTDKTFEDDPGDVYRLTPEERSSDMFSALVTFAVTQRQSDRIDQIDYDHIKRILKELLKKQKQSGTSFNQLIDAYIERNQWINDYNKEVTIDNYTGNLDLFLARVFFFYLKEEPKLEKMPGIQE